MNKTTSDKTYNDNNLRLNPFTLSFKDAEIEKRFDDMHYEKSLVPLRTALLICAVLYAGFSALDRFSSPLYYKEFISIRFLIVIPFLIITIAVSYLKIFRKIWKLLLTAAYLVGGIGIIFMLHRDPENLYYYGGLFLIFIAGYFFIKLPYFYATSMGVILILIFTLSYFFIPSGTKSNFISFLTVNSFYIASNVLCMMGLYSLEKLNRTSFYRQILLDKKQEEIKKINESLEQTVEERTKALNDTNKELFRTKENLKVKLDNILNPDTPISDMHITDLIDLTLLQRIQDSFSKATNTASLMVDTNGKPITRTSNSSKLCHIIRQTEKGKLQCKYSDKKIGQLAFKENDTVIRPCFSCGLYDAGTPIIVGNKVIAFWLIGQFRTADISEASILKYGREIGVDEEVMLSAFKNIDIRDLEAFHHIADLQKIISRELSSLAYNNLKLAKSNEEIKTHEVMLKEERDKALKADRLKSLFLANMSHEIRTPLNGILGFSEILASEALEPDEKDQYATIIKTSGDNLLKIINDLLDISALESNTLKIDPGDFNLSVTLKKIFDIYTQKIKQDNKDIEIKLMDTGNDLILYSDESRITQIITNLINNALKFTQSGFIEFGIKQSSKKEITAYVRDTGIGITKEQKDIIFNRFQQAEARTNKLYGGNGLGLSIVKELLRLLGGKIWVESEVDKGSTFYFTLPNKQP